MYVTSSLEYNVLKMHYYNMTFIVATVTSNKDSTEGEWNTTGN